MFTNAETQLIPNPQSALTARPDCAAPTTLNPRWLVYFVGALAWRGLEHCESPNFGMGLRVGAGGEVSTVSSPIINLNLLSESGARLPCRRWGPYGLRPIVRL